MANELGYYFHPAEQPAVLGYPQLDINIYDRPTGQHFDPIEVNLFVVGPGQGLDKLIIRHPWSGPRQYRVCPGRITLYDRRDKVVVAFTLGGELAVTNQGSYTSCTITSPAPIIHLLEGQEIATVLVSEFEVLLAEQRAEWTGDEMSFETRLAGIEPYTLFVAGLAAIRERLEHLPTQMREAQYRQVLHVIDEAIRLTQENGRWPASPPTLAELL